MNGLKVYAFKWPEAKVSTWVLRCDCCDDRWDFHRHAAAQHAADVHLRWHQARACTKCGRS